jgi:pimeloyl-ACP methyl ester carboxylesterase
VAAQAIMRAEASAPGSVAGATLITPWDELASAARARFWFLPVRLMLRDAYDSVQALANVRMPLVVVRAQQDALIPARATQSLFAQYPGQKTLIELPGSHVSWLSNTDARWWQGVCAAMSARNSLVTPES